MTLGNLQDDGQRIKSKRTPTTWSTKYFGGVIPISQSYPFTHIELGMGGCGVRQLKPREEK